MTEGRRAYATADNSKFLYFSPKGRLYGIWQWVIGGTLGLNSDIYAYVDSNAADVFQNMAGILWVGQVVEYTYHRPTHEVWY